MSIIKSKNIQFKRISFIVIFFIYILTVTIGSKIIATKNMQINTSKELSTENKEFIQYQQILESLFDYRNKAIMEQNEEILKELYDTEHKLGLWAYEHEVKKMKYLNNWSYKQGVTFKDIKTRVKLSAFKEKEEDLYGVICAVSTEYTYTYNNEPKVKNISRIGTHHYLNIRTIDGNYIITKEWYTDPFADSLNLENIKSDEIREYILNQPPAQYELSDKVQKAVEYAHMYCGAASDEKYGLKYNSKTYRNHNPEGGDCANYASQIMFESGAFSKNRTWNYSNGSGTKAWLNAQGFKNYILNSGRGSLLAQGSYEDVYRAAYKLRPGDVVAYEKNGRITHVSTVTGLDSKGYPLVTCHNTDRVLVPYDLGWSNKKIRFHLLHVHY
ncbi:amidase domain-containing protein [Anaerosacchariphilus polymeriproducens]